ncbi:phage virion morphogenesis protein [Candidatus Pantoea persica]|uniref:phage virion morphogenesis protein n=1 Tax=Candidatus Pantoea persica TaxID=2518128 RepID=UPI00215D8341|nr:phage virion morphogenesis protein [Candidatus Pantoea persica]MBA2814856.1 phage virion morphogenesis protein [Candidatus Pantoea persica]
MTSTILSVEITDNDLKLALKHLENAAYNLTPLMCRWSETLKTATDLNLEAQERPRWQPSVAALARQCMTLSQDEYLRRSVTPEYDAHQVLVGTNRVYARLHQQGGKAGRGRSVTLPLRPYLPVFEGGQLQAEVKRQLLDEVLDYLQQATHC